MSRNLKTKSLTLKTFLASLSQTQLSIPSVDIGLAQLAMHSTYETCGVKDVDYMTKALAKFYSVKLKFINNNIEIC